MVRDEGELAKMCDYIHYNPVKHGLAGCPAEWPYSTFGRWVRLGDYPPGWGGSSVAPSTVEDITSAVME
jgi:putative transposase